MKILLIKPPAFAYKTKINYSPNEPLGVMYLAAFLRENSTCTVKIVDASAHLGLEGWEGDFYRVGCSDYMIANEIRNFGPDLVGISAMFTNHSKGVHTVAALVKSVDKNIPVIAGGAHPSAFPDWVLSDKNIDMVVKGEGEQTLLEIVTHIEEKKDFSGIDGVVTRLGDGIKANRPRQYIKNLDVIPMPAWDLVNMEVYLKEDYTLKHAMKPPRATIVSSRGCPYKCVFCSIHSIWNHSYRMRGVKNVVDEIEKLVKEYGVREIAFYDDNLSVSRKRMMELCDEIILRKLKIRWCTPNGIAIWTLDKEVLDKMKKSGCYRLTFGIETASARTQKFIRKDFIDLEKSRELIRYCNKIGIWTLSSFIIGFPYETEEDIMQTIDFAANCELDMAFIYIATPYPGTEMYDIYKKENLLPNFDDKLSLEWIGNIANCMSDTKYFTKKRIEEYVQYAQKKVYQKRIVRFLNPLNIVHKISDMDNLKYFLKQSWIHINKLFAQRR